MALAEFFDIFGVIVFAVILILGIIMLEKSKKKIFTVIGWVLMAIGIVGVLVDGTIVLKTYILGG